MSRTYLQALVCSGTSDVLELGRLHNLSPGGFPIVCRYDLPAIARDVDRDAVAERPRGMWRWRELMPLDPASDPVTLGEGDTPLLRCDRLAAALELEHVWVKDESVNPTGSFKARGLSAAVTMAVELGARAFTIPSAGNAGGALAAYAARAGRRADVFVPADTPEINRLEVPLLGATLHLVDGLIHDCGRHALAHAKATGAFDVSTLKEPYRLEGKKTLGLELAEQFDWRLPDVIVYPTGGGTGLIGMHKAFDELAALGWLDSDARPRFVSVQADGCAPIVKAFHDGTPRAELWPNASTCASGLRVPVAVADFLILHALHASNGTAVAVADAELLRAMLELGALEGINACPEGGACVAAVRRLRQAGWIGAHERVVIFNTGAGTKYLEAMRSVSV